MAVAVRRCGGGMLDPAMAGRFADRAEALLGELDAADPRTLVLEAEPRPVVSVPEGGLAEVAAALPDARIEVVEGQQHVADALAPELVAGHLVAFLGGRR